MTSPDVTDQSLLAPLPTIEQHLAARCDEAFDASGPHNLRAAMRYALLGGGKRLRPLLCWHACVSVGAPGEASLDAGAALEFIHAFSLVHDDLPAIDDDDLRRGLPTLHRHAGEAMAILTGDALLTLAFRLLNSLPIARRGLAISHLADATWAMVKGQVEDTIPDPADASPAAERVDRIHRNKTGALIRASCSLGAICGLQDLTDPAQADRLRCIEAYGEHTGLMFQVVDDLLDLEQSAEHTGKRTGKDANKGKLTHPGVHGIAASRAEVARLRDLSLDSIVNLGPQAAPLRALTDRLATRTK